MLGDNGEILLLNNLITQIETTDTTELTCGNDTISGNAASDHMLGGVGGDTIYGDAAAPGPDDGDDVILGDQGIYEYNLAAPYDGNPVTLDRVRTKDTNLGASDIVLGNAQLDVVLGGTAGDLIHGNRGDDLVLGDFGEVRFGSVVVTKLGIATPHTEYTLYATITDNALGGSDTVYADEDEDVVAGGAYGDNLDGGSQDHGICGAIGAGLRGPRGADQLMESITEPRRTRMPTATGYSLIQIASLPVPPLPPARVPEADADRGCRC